MAMFSTGLWAISGSPTSTLDVLTAAGTNPPDTIDLDANTPKTPTYIGYNSSGSGSQDGFRDKTSRWKLSSSRTISFKVQNCDSVALQVYFTKDATTSVKYQIGSGTATEFITNGSDKKCEKTAGFSTGTSDEITFTISSSNDLLLGYIYLFPSPQDPTLTAITIAGVDCDIIAANPNDQDTISAELPYGTVIADAIAAITDADVTLGGSATGWEIDENKTKITVSDDDSHTQDYIFNLTISASASTDATLKSLSLNDVDIELEDAVFEYDVELPYATSVTVDYATNNASATVNVDKSVAGTVTITVTAQAGNYLEYIVNYTFSDAPKSLTRALFSNGFDAFIDTTNKTVKAYYLAGTDAPTLSSTTGDGEAAIVGDKIVVTAADSKTLEFDLTLEEVTPNTTVVEEGTAAGTFDGTEAWIKAGLHISAPATGYTNNKYILRRQLRENDPADDQRVIAGLVRAYFFVGNASKFEFTQGSNKGIKYAIDGGSYSSATTEASVSIPLEAGNHIIEIVTTQSSGNCEISAPRLVKRTATALDNTTSELNAIKHIENGQLIIEKNGVRYNAMGQIIR